MATCFWRSTSTAPSAPEKRPRCPPPRGQSTPHPGYLEPLMAAQPSTTSPDDRTPEHKASWWGDRGVSTKILSAVGVAGVVAAGVGIMGLTALGSAAATSQNLYGSNITAINATSDMTTAIADVRKAARDALITPDPAEKQSIVSGIPDLAATFENAVSAYENTSPTAEKQDLGDQAGTAVDQYIHASKTVLAPFAVASNTAGWYVANKSQVAPLANRAD